MIKVIVLSCSYLEKAEDTVDYYASWKSEKESVRDKIRIALFSDVLYSIKQKIE